MCDTPLCSTCTSDDKRRGVFICTGCEQSLCTAHFTDHRDELNSRFEDVIRQYHAVQELFNENLTRFNDQQEKTLAEIRKQLAISSKTKNYSDKDLDAWTTQLNQLKQSLPAAPRTYPAAEIRPVLNTQVAVGRQWIDIFVIFLLVGLLLANALVRPYFGRVQGPIRLLEGGHVAEHTSARGVSGSFRVLRYCSIPVDSAQIKVKRISSSSEVFIGVVSQNEDFNINSAYGWLISDGRIQENAHSMIKFWTQLKDFWFSITAEDTHSDRSPFQQNDTLKIEMNQLRSEMTLQNQRTKINYHIKVPVGSVPMPWQIVINLNGHGDRVHLN